MSIFNLSSLSSQTSLSNMASLFAQTAKLGNLTQNAIVSTSTPGKSAAQNNSPFPQNILQLSNPKYNFKQMYYEQSAKQTNPQLRFSLAVGSISFNAHIDPYHIVNEQSKRLVEINVNTGIVIQDFGYFAQSLELRGTTGAAFFTEIKKMDDIFNQQSTKGIPIPATLTLELITYQGVWRGFSFERQAQKNTYDYTISFTVLQRGGVYNPNLTATLSPILSMSNAEINTIYNNGLAQTTSVAFTGMSPRQYLMSEIPSALAASQLSSALTYVKNSWDTIGNGSAYPGDNAPLGLNPSNGALQYLTIPLIWSNVLSTTPAPGST